MGHASASPTCPVARFPPDPSCADRPVAGVAILVTDASGREVARTVTGPDGAYAISVPPGTYTLTPQPVTGIMHAAGPQNVTVGCGATATVDFVFDTGIR